MIVLVTLPYLLSYKRKESDVERQKMFDNGAGLRQGWEGDGKQCIHRDGEECVR